MDSSSQKSTISGLFARLESWAQRRLSFFTSSPVGYFLVHLGISVLLGLLWFFVLYNRYPLYVSHVNYLYNLGGDALQRQLGWEFFRLEPWTFPLGGITAYGYPFGTSVTFMDSIPLIAIPFKLLSPWLDAQAQFIGIWELASIIGQVLAGMLILREFTRSMPLKALGASLLVLSPPMIFRAFYHSSLSAHWILLLAAWFILLEHRKRLWRGAWVALFGVVTWIHFYFVAMLLPFWLIAVYFRCRGEPRKWRALLEGLALAAVVLGAGFCIGMFNLQGDALTASGFGAFSWNLNGFFNPFDFASAYLKGQQTVGGGQYEGISYLGLGNLFLLPVALYLFAQKDCNRRTFKFLLPFGVMAVPLALFALSNNAYLYDIPLWKIELPQFLADLAGVFRSSGRFIWPLFYFVVLFGVLMTIRHFRRPALLLIFVIVLQLSDLQPMLEGKKLSGFAQYESSLNADFWQPAADANQHLVIIPERKLTQPYEPFAIYAVHNGLTLNLGYFARHDAEAFKAYGQQVWQELQAGQAQADTLYVITDPAWIESAQKQLRARMYVCTVDGFTLLFARENALAQSQVNLSAYCGAQP